MQRFDKCIFLWRGNKRIVIILTAYNCKLVRMLFVSHWRTTECVYLHRIHSARWKYTHTNTHSRRKEGPHFLAWTIDTVATNKLLEKRLHTSYTLVKRKWDGFSQMDGMWLVWWLRVELSQMTHTADTDRTDGRRPVPDSDAVNVHVCWTGGCFFFTVDLQIRKTYH